MQLKARAIFLLGIDIVTFVVALLISLALRSGGQLSQTLLWAHVAPFGLLLCLWLIIFYIVGVYEAHDFSERFIHAGRFTSAVIISLIASVIFFYLIPSLEVSPKTILALLGFWYLVIGFSLRNWALRLGQKAQPATRIALLGDGQDMETVRSKLEHSSVYGYHIVAQASSLSEAFLRACDHFRGVDIIVVTAACRRDLQTATTLYQGLLSGVDVVAFSDFYEGLFGKVSLDELGEDWFVDRLTPKNRSFLIVKRILDIILAVVVLLITLPLWPLIALVIMLSSRGPILKFLPRVGQNEQIFLPYKFRTMHLAGDVTDKPTATFGTQHRDPRIFSTGRLFRKLRLDELPQVINILRGEMSFVGPRADFEDFYRLLKDKIPYYQIRTIVTPGLTGWAQIHNRYGSSIEGARERLAYDVYYLKHQSFLLDGAILLKTFKTIFTFSGI